MPKTLAYRLAGETIGLSVGAASHAAVTIQSADPSANGLVCCNTSTAVVVYVTAKSSPNGSLVAAPASAVPGDGTAGAFPILAYDDTVMAGMSFPVSVTAIGSAAGPTLLTVTPVTLL